MSSYPVHTIESAPAQSKPVLQQLQQAFGLIAVDLRSAKAIIRRQHGNSSGVDARGGARHTDSSPRRSVIPSPL
jgi:hypothetical protein